MTDPGHVASVWTDRSFLRDVQYKTDVNLATRQFRVRVSDQARFRRAAPGAGPEPVVAYVRSMRETARLPDPEPLVEAVAGRLQAAPGAVFRVTTHSGCLICA
jgi:hypothetical protein